nr:helitron helicase-like domain-containing protein [Tanacetum cinerariifolium]
KGKRKPNLGGRAAGRLNTHDKTQNLSLKEITDKKGPVPIHFELRDKQTVMPLSDHAAHWSSYIREVIRGVPLYYPSWLKVPKERKAVLITDIGTQFDQRPHMESPDLTEINAGIQQHLQKAYNTNKAAFKAQHWVIDTTTGTYNLEKIRRARLEKITASEWEAELNHSGVPVVIDTFFVAHTVNREFLRDEDRCIYEEMRRLEATGTYTDDEINRLAREGKQRGHIPGVGRVLPARATASPRLVGAGTTRRVPTIRTTRMAMVILSCVIYGSFLSLGNMCHRGTNFLTEKYVGPTVSLGKESFASVPQRTFHDDKSPGKSDSNKGTSIGWHSGDYLRLPISDVQVLSRLRETESSSNISPTCFKKNYDAINAVAVNVGAHVRQPKSLSTFEPTLSTEIFSESVGNGTASECNVALDNDIFTESIFLQKERGSELNRQQQEGSSTFVSANVGTSSYTHNCSPFRHSDEPGEPLRVLQLYVYDTQNEVANGMCHFGGEDKSGLRKDIVEGLIQDMDEHNALVYWVKPGQNDPQIITTGNEGPARKE